MGSLEWFEGVGELGRSRSDLPVNMDKEVSLVMN